MEDTTQSTATAHPIGTTELTGTTEPTGSEKRYHLRVIQHTGFLLGWHQSTRQVVGTYDHCMAEYAKAQRHNLIFGWWGVASILFLNWFALISNLNAANMLKRVAGKV